MTTRFLLVTTDGTEYTNDMFEGWERSQFQFSYEIARRGCPAGSRIDLHRVEYNDAGDEPTYTFLHTLTER